MSEQGWQLYVRALSHHECMKHARPSAGFTLIEMLVVIAIIGIIAAIAVSYLPFKRPARDAAREVQGELNLIKAEAMANIQARRMVLLNDQRLMVQSADRCQEATAANWQEVRYFAFSNPSPQVTLSVPGTAPTDASLPADARLIACFNGRGLATIPEGSTVGKLQVSDNKQTFIVEVAGGGGVRTVAP